MSLYDIIDADRRATFATNAGTRVHRDMGKIVLGTPSGDVGNPEYIAHIRHDHRLIPLFDTIARTEVPIAGRINGRFISRRIDRLRVFDDVRRVVFIDYKTDTDPEIMRHHYRTQLGEYATLLHEIYPDYTIDGYILWMHDWTLDHIVAMNEKP